MRHFILWGISGKGLIGQRMDFFVGPIGFVWINGRNILSIFPCKVGSVIVPCGSRIS